MRAGGGLRQVATQGAPGPKLDTLRTKALPYQVRHLDKERPAVATEPRNNLSGERMDLVQVHVVVVSHIERCARAWCPTGEKLGARPLTECVVIDNRAR